MVGAYAGLAIVSTETRRFKEAMQIITYFLHQIARMLKLLVSENNNLQHSSSRSLMCLISLVFSHNFVIQDGCCPPVTPPPSCLCDASVLLAAILRYTLDSTTAGSMTVEALLQVWANLVADWNAWEEEEDESVFDSIEEAVALQVWPNLICMVIMIQFRNFCKSLNFT